MRENEWSFRPTHTLWMTANNDPKVTDRTESVWQRMQKVPFDRTFTGDDRDNQLAEKLRAEYPVMLAWAIRGCLDWQRRGGLDAPTAVTAATQEYRADQDWLAQFIDDCCTLDPDGIAYSGKLYASYRQWAVDNGIRSPVTNTALTRTLKTRADITHLKQHGTERKPAFKGLAVRAT